MFTSSGVSLTGALVWTSLLLFGAYLFQVVVFKVISNRLALIRFKKLSKNLPLYPESRLLGNHLIPLALGQRNCASLQQCHQELGPTIGWLYGSQYAASTIDLNLIKTFILDEPEAHLNRTKFNLPLGEVENSIMLAPDHEWHGLRRAIAPALTSNKFKTPNVLDEIEESIRRVVALIERRLDAANGDPNHLFAVDEFMHKYSLDLVFRCLYKQTDVIDFDDPHDRWVTIVDEGFDQVQRSWLVKLAGIFPELRGLLDWLVLHFTKQGHLRRETLLFVKLQTRQALQAREQFKELKRVALVTGTSFDKDNFKLNDGTIFRRNMVDYIIDQYLNGKLTRAQYFNNSSFLIAAAYRTSSDCLTYAIYQLSINQDIQDKVRKSVLTDGHESKYLEWVIKESLRLLPPAPLGCSRKISRDISLDSGHVLPAGTYVVVCAYVIHRLKQYWGEDADEFRPERWHDTSHHHPLQFIPFGAGLRGCPGKALAMHEMKMLLAGLLARFRFEGESQADVHEFGSPWWIFINPRSPTKVRIHRL